MDDIAGLLFCLGPEAGGLCMNSPCYSMYLAGWLAGNGRQNAFLHVVVTFVQSTFCFAFSSLLGGHCSCVTELQQIKVLLSYKPVTDISLGSAPHKGFVIYGCMSRGRSRPVNSSTSSHSQDLVLCFERARPPPYQGGPFQLCSDRFG